MIVIGVVLVVVVAVVVGTISMYNGLVKLRNRLQESWRQVDVELNRRYDLIPNLVQTVQGYAGFEQSTLRQVIELRNQAQALSASGRESQQRANAEGQLGAAVSNFLVTAEAYPELKANQNFQQLASELSQTEDRIANSRRYYNAIVGDYNTKIESFPSNLIAGSFKFQKAGYFEVNDPAMRAAQKVDFSGLNQPPQVGFQNPPTLPPQQ
jgi:LemA protein